MSNQEVTAQYVDIDILVKNDDENYENIFKRSYAVAGVPRKGEIILVDGVKYEVKQIEYNTQRSEAHIVTVYADVHNESVGAFFCRSKRG